MAAFHHIVLVWLRSHFHSLTHIGAVTACRIHYLHITDVAYLGGKTAMVSLLFARRSIWCHYFLLAPRLEEQYRFQAP